MTESAELQSQGRLVFNDPSVESGAGSINSEQVSVSVRSPQESDRFTPEGVEEFRRNHRKLDLARYFALKVTVLTKNSVLHFLII